MNTTSKITSKGQLTIPCYIRNRFGFNTGDTVEFEEGTTTLSFASRKTLWTT